MSISLRKYFFSTFLFSIALFLIYAFLLVTAASALPIWTYPSGFSYQNAFLGRAYPFSMYPAPIIPSRSFSNPPFQLPPWEQPLPWQNPISSWSRPAAYQFSLGGISNNVLDIPGISQGFFPGYPLPRYSAFSGPDAFFNGFSLFSALNPALPLMPPPLARSAAVTFPPPPAGPPAPLGIDSSQILYKPPAFQSIGVSYVPNQPGYVTGQVLATFVPGTPAMEMNRLYAAHQCRELYTSPYAGFKILAIPSFVTVREMCRRLSLEPSILSVSPNYYRHAHFLPNDPYYKYQWHLPRLNCSLAWDYGTGTGALVGVLDSGVAYQTAGVYTKAPDLAGTLFVPGYDFINLDPYPDDDYGHGTHMTGCIAQTTDNLLGVAGVAFNATIMPVKVMDNTGSTPISNEVDGIYFATNNGVNIINMSLGGAGISLTEQDACTYAYTNGVTIICSAGNAGSNIPEYPASYAECISVSAVRYDNTIPAYSNYGQYITLCAPGGDLSVDQNWDGLGDGILQQTHDGVDLATFYYYFMEGTSPACALVSGVAALIVGKSTVPLTPLQVTDILTGTATDLGVIGWDQYYGSGLVNAYQALLQTP